ncbi:MAG: hypothetical protein ABSC06_32680 [Rhodopila sp.]|jgi:hypothetical protein
MSAPEVPVCGERTRGVWPVREHLRPRPDSPKSWCSLYSRTTPNGYDEDFTSVQQAFALPVEGEA